MYRSNLLPTKLGQILRKCTPPPPTHTHILRNPEEISGRLEKIFLVYRQGKACHVSDSKHSTHPAGLKSS